MLRNNLFLLSASLMAIFPVAFAEDLAIGGSDLLSAPIRTALEGELLTHGLQPDLQFHGSIRGMKAMEDGSLEVALLAMPDGGEFPDSYNRILIACEIAVMAVHQDNPLRVLSFEQLRKIFLPDGPVENWSDLTDSMDWYGRKIELMAVRKKESVNLQLLSSASLGGEGFRPEVRFLETDGEGFVQTIASAPNTLVLAPGFKEQAPVRFLSIKVSDTSEAYSPTQDNVYFGDYPLRLPFYLVYKRNFDQEKLAMLLQALFSAGVTSALEEALFITVPIQERRSLLSQD